jgi:hypothetical protein
MLTLMNDAWRVIARALAYAEPVIRQLVNAGPKSDSSAD